MALMEEIEIGSGFNSNCFRDMFPAVEPRIIHGEMKYYSSNGFPNPNGYFQQTFSQGGYLSPRKSSSCRSNSHLLHKHVGGCGHEDSKLIGKKTCAARPINLQSVMQFFDSILGISSAAIDLVNILRFVRKIGDHETVIVPGITAGTSHDFGLDDDAAPVRPFPCCIAGLAKEGLGLPGLSRFHSDLPHQAAGSLFQSGISGHSNEVLDTLQFEIVEDLGCCEPPIEPDPKASSGKCIPQPGQKTHQDSESPARCRCVAWPQDNGEEILFNFVIELQRSDHRQIAIRIVVTVEERELLCPVRGIVRRIQVDRNQAGLAFQSLGVMFDDDIGQLATQTQEVFA